MEISKVISMLARYLMYLIFSQVTHWFYWEIKKRGTAIPPKSTYAKYDSKIFNGVPSEQED